MEVSPVKTLTAASDLLKFLILEVRELAILSFQVITGMFRRPCDLDDRVEPMNLLRVEADLRAGPLRIRNCINDCPSLPYYWSLSARN